MKKLEKKDLIAEEQKIVDKLIIKIEKDIKNADNRLCKIIGNYRKAKEQGPEAYGVIVDSHNSKNNILTGMERARQSKDELYTCRLIVECQDADGFNEELEIKIGLSSYIGGKNQEKLLYNWKENICRHFLLDNCSTEYDEIKYDNRYGEKYITHYTLKMKRNVNTRFAHVKDVIELFPMASEEDKQILYDAFLEELANRRENTEFHNIIFSIQKKQGDIIQLPVDENLIVQGCAGSGKSMIMLHRLPILLYDHPDKLNNKNVYIITPSDTYIQMVENMRQEMEITEIKMGTLNQYYDYILSKYRVDLDDYGHISYATKVTSEQEKYVYNDEMINDILSQMQILVEAYDSDFDKGCETLNISKRVINNQKIDVQIANYILMGTDIINRNNDILKENFIAIIKCLNSIKEMSNKIKDRKNTIIKNISRKIKNEESIINTIKSELNRNNKLGQDDEERLDEYEVHELKLKIVQSEVKLKQYKEVKKQVDNDEVYFERLNYCFKVFEAIEKLINTTKPHFEDNSREDIYNFIEKKEMVYSKFVEFSLAIDDIEDKYNEYAKSITKHIEPVKEKVFDLVRNNNVYLDSTNIDKIKSTIEYYKDLQNSIAKKVYLEIMKKCGQDIDKKGKIKALSFSPYIYVQIMYLMKGAPNSTKEKLICIDEAQGVAPSELKLIKNLNGGDVIFNLFGDEKQHIEGTKGIDSWSEFSETVDVKPMLLMENYRNACQITDECNKRFDMEMRAINTPGSGVTIINDENDFDKTMRGIFVNTKRPGLSAIIVDDVFEAKQIVSNYAIYDKKIHNMTEENHDFHRTRWNLLTVEQAKGLEFATVIVLSGRMTPNKKYIAYTRALDKLYIYDEPIEIKKIIIEDIDTNDKNNSIDEKKISKKKEKREKKTIDYSQSKVRNYFEDKGLEVNDMRDKGGYLWIIGEQVKIKQYVDEACEKFGISGAYGQGKATRFRPGCYFKTKK